MKRFLQFAVEQTLLGDATGVKEYAVALAVYDKPESFDPRTDPIVRVEASRLRAKLREYYEDEGRDDPVVISIRKGGYSAVFKKRRKTSPRKVALDGHVAGPRNPEAHHLYLMGRHYWNKRNTGGIEKSMECFQGAIRLDPADAMAHAGLADCYASQACFEIGAPGMLWDSAEREALAAQALDPSLAEASATRACRQAVYDWNWSGAEAGFRAAIAMEPQYATARHWYGFFCLAPQRRLSAAMEEVMRAFALDPLSPVIGTHLGCILYFRRRHEQAVEQYLRAIELDPTFHLAYWFLGWTYTQLSRFDDAKRAIDQARTLGTSEALCMQAAANLEANAGNRESAESLIDALQTLSKNSYVSPVGFALLATVLGECDVAFAWLKRAVAERSCRLAHLKVEPGFDKLKTDPRFLSILSAIHLL